ncbi:hypothetical protein DQ240_05330 [Blastococcus sp. TF02A-26]|nr:hypothetical protein DQ240_05330 [Blastococcus sp. TF02A-26]
MALTFGTLLSSQGTDALVLRPFQAFVRGGVLTVPHAPQQWSLEGRFRRLTGLEARSVLAWCRENHTRL